MAAVAGIIYLLLLAVQAAVILAGVFIAMIAVVFGKWAYPIVLVLFVLLLVVSL